MGRLGMVLISLTLIFYFLNKSSIISDSNTLFSITYSNAKPFQETLISLNMTDYVVPENVKSIATKNLVVISLESLESSFLKEPFKHLTPELSRLKEEWTYIPVKQNIGSDWTSGSIYTMLTGIPAFFGVQANTIFKSSKESYITSLSTVLSEANYELAYFCGDANFSGMKDMLYTLDFDRVMDYTSVNYPVEITPFGLHDKDVFDLKSNNLLPLNLEMASTTEMKEICIKVSPEFCCIVPEKREELTTEGGLNVRKKVEYLRDYIEKIKDNGTKVSLFIDPEITQIDAAIEVGADAVELHTGKYSLLFEKGSFNNELRKIKESAEYCVKNKIVCNAGHGLNFKNVTNISKIRNISELNVGHFIIAQSLFYGLKETISKFREIINESRF